MKKLKIVILDLDDIKNPLLNAGQARATYEVGKRLIGRGHEVSVISSRFPGSKNRIQDGIRYSHIGLGTKNIRINNAAYILNLPFVVPTIKADIIIECFTAPISTLFTPLFTKIPVVIVPSSFEAERFSSVYHLPFNKVEKLGMQLYKYALPYTDVVNEKIKRLNTSIETRIVPEGVSEDYFKIKKQSPKHLLFLSRFDISQKGIDLLLEAFSKVAGKVSLPLVLAGDGPDKQRVRKLVKSYKLSDKIEMVGPAYGEKKNSLLSQALAVIIPSRDETFSLFALESIASKTPVLKFDIVGLKWMPDSIVLKCKAFDTTALSKLILKICNDRKLATALGTKSRFFAKKFSWEKVAKSYEEFFLDILQKDSTGNKSETND